MYSQDLPKLMLPIGHTSFVYDAHFSPNEDGVLTNSADKTAKVWDLKRGKLIFDLSGHSDQVIRSGYSENGKLIYTVDSENQFHLWDADTGKSVFKKSGSDTSFKWIQFNEKNNTILHLDNSSTINEYEINTGDLINSYSIDTSEIALISFNKNTHSLRVINSNGTIAEWELVSNELINKWSMGIKVSHATLNQTSNYIYLIDSNHSLNIFNIRSGHLEFKSDSSKLKIKNISLSNFGETVAAWGQGKYFLFVDINKKYETRIINSEHDIRQIKFSPKDDQFILLSRDSFASVYTTNNVDKLFDIKVSTTPVRRRNIKKSNGIKIATYSPNGKQIALVNQHDFGVEGISTDESAQIFDASTGKFLYELLGHTYSIRKLKYNASGKLILTAGFDDSAKLWNTENGKLLKDFKGYNESIYTLKHAPNKDYFITSSNKMWRVWESQTGNINLSKKGSFPAKAGILGHNGELLTQVANSKKISIINTENGKELYSLKDTSDWKYPVAYSNNLNTMVLSTQDSFEIVDVSSGNITTKFYDPYLYYNFTAKQAQISPDRKYLCTVGVDSFNYFLENKFVNVWDFNSGQLLHQKIKHEGPISSIEFNSDGSQLLTSSYDSTAALWNIKTGELLNTMGGMMQKFFTLYMILLIK